MELVEMEHSCTHRKHAPKRFPNFLGVKKKFLGVWDENLGRGIVQFIYFLIKMYSPIQTITTNLKDNKTQIK
jgi:hypothetical protein